MAPLTNKKIVVVGGSSGIGFAVAKAALAEGASVVVCSSSQDKVNAAARRLGAGLRVAAEVLNITDEADVKALFEKIGKFDHLVITAGKGGSIPDFRNVELSSIKDSAFDVRYWGPIYCIKHSQAFRAPGGSVTLTSGTATERPHAGWALSVGGGGALMATLRTLALDLAPARVNCIAPGLVSTEMWAGMPAEQLAGMRKIYEAKLPVRHIAEPEELAEAYLFAMKCEYLTGQTLFVDGGQLLV